MPNKLPKDVLLPCELIGKVSERAVILYSLIRDLMRLSAENPQYQDDDGKPYVLFTIERVESIFHIGQTQAKAVFKELVSAGLVVRVKQGCGKPTRIYLAESEGRKTDCQRDGKPTVKRDGKSSPSHHKESVKNSQCISSSGGGSKNQAMFESLLSKMLTDDVISKILCKLVADNQTEFSEVNADIINFVAENIRKAVESKQITNLKGYCRQALRHGKADCENSKETPAPPKNSKKIQGYAATYDIALYERYSGADDYFIIDGHKRYLKDLSTEEITVLREKGYESRCDWDD